MTLANLQSRRAENKVGTRQLFVDNNRNVDKRKGIMCFLLPLYYDIYPCNIISLFIFLVQVQRYLFYKYNL